jgi:hypothetical protein
VTVDEERLRDAVAEFRISRDLEQGPVFTRFLADNDLSAGDFEQLIGTDELVRWACGQAEGDAFSGLLDDLRLNGEYARLVARARAKLDYGEPPDTAGPEGDAIQWYFAQRRGTAVPDDLAGYARSCGFPDGQAFRTAVRHEYRTRCSPIGRRKARAGQRRGGRTSSASSATGSARPSAVTPICSPSCCPGHGRQSRPACSTSLAEWRRTRAASGTARRSRSTRTSCTAWAWLP